MENIGTRVRTKRQSMRMKQNQLARIIGCSTSYISFVEVGKRRQTGQPPVVGAEYLAKFEEWLSSGAVLVPLEVTPPKPTQAPAPAEEVTVSDLEEPKRHEKFAALLYFVKRGQHTYLWGPSGSGKSTGAEHVAAALDLRFGYISLNPQTSEFRLIGYKDANGKYNTTEFRQCYEFGGVFCIDELDNSNPALLTTLNGALESGLYGFPDGMVERHEDFRCVATGNTNGRGASKAFPDRRKMDGALMDRFAFIEWGYDESLEMRIANDLAGKVGVTLSTWVQNIRQWACEHAPLLAVTPRATFRLCKDRMALVLTTDDLLEACLFHGIDQEIKRNALRAHSFPRAQVRPS